jgi:hypothetical protein
VSIRCTERLAGAGIKPSVGSVGGGYDNALAETVIGLFKTEVIRRRGPWRALAAAESATLDWVDWFNTHRLLEPVGDIPPAEAEERHYAQQEETALAACLKPTGLRRTRRGSVVPTRRGETRPRDAPLGASAAGALLSSRGPPP